ncbi:hypothetical protein [Pyxidicoccus caerfyrddinensis]|uniref:hypothetical protein n=1 Tax=Pyxidicoccus caerfyrddinensis TaxID=2709663 RepID=UPI0013DCDB5D|nr:hypothetical protein [Pyxidicoccus caerfyrddinensis]
MELSTVISRMLSVRPETRGTAHELAEALEQAARDAGPQAKVPLFLSIAAPPQGEVERSPASQPVRAPPEKVKAPLLKKAPEPDDAEATPQHLQRRGLYESWQLWLSAGLAGAVVLAFAPNRPRALALDVHQAARRAGARLQ